jgi:hypothetical protein
MFLILRFYLCSRFYSLYCSDLLPLKETSNGITKEVGIELCLRGVQFESWPGHSYPDRFCGFSQSLQADAGIIP